MSSPERAEQPSEGFSELNLSVSASDYLERFKRGETDGISCWRSPLVERRPGSKIEGVGLFAKEDVKRGEVVAIKPGHVAGGLTIKDNEDIIKGSHQQIGINQFITGLTAEEVEKNLVGYNHSCDPNAKVVIEKGLPLALLVTKKPIQKNQEITTDYSVSQISNTHRIFICKCGSDECRGIVDPTSDWMQEDTQGVNTGDFPWYVEEKIDELNSMSVRERQAFNRRFLTLHTADIISLLATDLKSELRDISKSRIFLRPFKAALHSASVSRTYGLLLTYAEIFAKVCPFANIEDMGIERNKPETVSKNIDKLIKFAVLLDRNFN